MGRLCLVPLLAQGVLCLTSGVGQQSFGGLNMLFGLADPELRLVTRRADSLLSLRQHGPGLRLHGSNVGSSLLMDMLHLRSCLLLHALHMALCFANRSLHNLLRFGPIHLDGC